jgi:hypothetical protein
MRLRTLAALTPPQLASITRRFYEVDAGILG